jgi:ABC-type phosphate transport system substrate-binding protein
MGYQLGVDLGSANTVVAVADDGWPQVLALSGGTDMPTVLYASPGGEIQAGRTAERRAATDPDRVARGFPRRVGDPTPILLGEAAYTPEALVARLLGWVVAAATRLRRAPPDHVAVAHPASWSQFRCDLFAEAVSQIDADVPVTVCSSADAVGALLNRRGSAVPGTFVGIYDLGAGSFEAAVLAAMPTGFQLAGTPAGITRAGGMEIDAIVFAHVLRGLDDRGPDDAVSGSAATDPAMAAALRRLRYECVQAKEILTEDDAVDIPIGITGMPESVRLTRDTFESLIRPMVDDTIRVLERVLRSVPAAPADLSALLLLGGAARIPLVGRVLAEACPDITRQEIGSPADIALGAALIAAQSARQVVPPFQTVIIGPPALSVPPVLSVPPALSVPPESGVPLVSPTPTPTSMVPPVVGEYSEGTTRSPGLSRARSMPPTGNTPSVPAPAVPIPPTEPPDADRASRPVKRRLFPGVAGTRRGIAAVAVAALVLVTAVTAGTVAYTRDSQPVAAVPSAGAAGPAGAVGQTATQSSGPAVQAGNVVLASGSSEVAPITETAYALFRQQQSGVVVRAESTSTDDGFTRLCQGAIDIAGASFAMNTAFKGDPGCADRVAEFEIAHNTLPVIVNPQNTWARCLTLSQLTKIWAKGSTVTNWRQIDPSFPDEPVDLFGPAPTSVHGQVFNHDVNGASDNVRGYHAVDLEGVAQNVAQNRDALGFLDFPTFETYGNKIRGVELDNGKGNGCVPPSVVSAGTGTYLPLCKPLYLYVSKAALRKPATAAFVTFYLRHGQDIAFKAHAVPRNDATTADNVNLAKKLTEGVGPVVT